MADATVPSGAADYRKILKRVGIAVIIAGFISSLNIIAIITGVFLFRGSLKAARFGAWIFAYLLGGSSVCLVIVPFIVPKWIDGMIYFFYHQPLLFFSFILFLLGAFALFIWIYMSLRSAPILCARADAGLTTSPPRTAWIVGVLFSLMICGAMYFVVNSNFFVADLEVSPEDIKQLTLKAEQGNMSAELSLGGAYGVNAALDNGKEKMQDDIESAKWYLKAAEQGSMEGQYMIAGKYRDGEGVPKDLAKAAKWYRKSAEQGDDSAQYELRRMYEQGLVSPK